VTVLLCSVLPLPNQGCCLQAGFDQSSQYAKPLQAHLNLSR
jgi:hypothetical protein